MKVGLRVQSRITVFAVSGAVAADARAWIIGHVIDDGVDINTDAGGEAAIDHVDEFGAVAGTTAVDAVADRLIAFAPRIVGRLETVFLGGRDLDGVVAGGTEHRLALICNVGPFPLEEMDENVTARGPTRRAIRLRQHRTSRWRRANDRPGQVAATATVHERDQRSTCSGDRARIHG